MVVTLDIRNFMPRLPQGQFPADMFEQASTRSWFEQRATTNKTLNTDQDAFWKPKQSEELDDLQEDPYETQNLTYGPKHDLERQRLSFALSQWLVETRDLQLRAGSPAPVTGQGKLAQGYLCHRRSPSRMATPCVRPSLVRTVY